MIANVTLDQQLESELERHRNEIESIYKVNDVFNQIDFTWFEENNVDVYVIRNATYIYITITNAAVEDVIEHLAGPIHRITGYNWEMELDTATTLSGKEVPRINLRAYGPYSTETIAPPHIYISYNDDADEKIMCSIVKQKVRERSDEELKEIIESMKTVYEYKMACA